MRRVLVNAKKFEINKSLIKLYYDFKDTKKNYYLKKAVDSGKEVSEYMQNCLDNDKTLKIDYSQRFISYNSKYELSKLNFN